WCIFFFFFQAEDGIRDRNVTGVQTCALPIYEDVEVQARGLISEALALGVLPTDDVTGRLEVHQALEQVVGRPSAPVAVDDTVARSEERRVGKECRSRSARGGQRAQERARGAA